MNVECYGAWMGTSSRNCSPILTSRMRYKDGREWSRPKPGGVKVGKWKINRQQAEEINEQYHNFL